VDFTHGPGIVFERYFDRDTGRLVLTVRGGRDDPRERRDPVDGVRFPKKIVSTTKTATGKDLVSTVTFDSIVLNEPLPTTSSRRPSILPDKAPRGRPAGK
jgi:hypothetical protein